MKLSIITVNLNNATGLLKTIQSVVSQTWQEFEYIVIDGGSNDGSVEIIKQYEDYCYSWVSEEDTGVYQAMNKGIARANGTYLLFLNSGDFLLNELVLESIFTHDYEADILCGRCNLSQNGVVKWTTNPPNMVTFATLYHGGGLAHQSTFIRKTLFEKLGFYKEDYKYNSDIEFWYRSIILNDASTHKLDIVVTDYNLEGISNSGRLENTYLIEMEEILIPFKKIIPDYDSFNEEKESMKIYSWAKKHKIIDKILYLTYKFCKTFK